MEFDWIWNSILVVIGGTLLLRIAGRKSISQMTLAQVVIMIGIGSLLIEPVSGESIWTTLAVGLILVLTLVVMEYAQMKSDKFEKFITGQSKIIIEDGKLNEQNLRKLRFTVDQLEMKLRQHNVAVISDVRWATLEANGQVGYELKEEAQPVTKKEFLQLQADVQQLIHLLEPAFAKGFSVHMVPENEEDIFTEVAEETTDSVPDRLQ
ncbi:MULTISPECIES: DUF421 domain-containing protein [Cytobacillus]|uniref:YetF C-terminal domain-containing protein n=3 Tax=Cytobacillus TaxID=2675230 RepID=A0A160M6T0_9BACI|nr:MULTISPECIES: DUF421 domain-containing protein [Cytobacillus]MBY0162485.1 DUF421 domain-containing protein [Cytobacillus firmus]AND37914.1 hypothetical protein A361_01695 [Cytobacillus oceanisediminis 2691]MBU8733209.1 DUF421 domain-containing protein [Cytobacillus oceanisediminis]MCM3395861.1 DUF421 domain-containing protein [Cytobacillus oceanisediminis]MCM3532447.1 DUF421 domain-containing protein [Cytobacillus oceanisediminis]